MVRRLAHIAAHLDPDPAAVGRFSVIGETWAQIVDRVSSALCRRPSERQEIRTVMQSAELVPAGQILRWAGHPNGVLYNCFVTEADPGEDARNVPARFTAWIALGARVGANVSAWCKARGTEVQRLREIVDTVAQSQQLLRDTDVTRTATMLDVDFQLSGVVDVCAELSANSTYHRMNMGAVISDRAIQEAAEARQLKERKSAREDLERLAAVDWCTGNPGLIFNLAAFVSESGFDLARFHDGARVGVRMLDATIDASDFPTKEAASTAPRAYDIPARQHVRVAATWQRHIDGGISQTVNVPANATVYDVIGVFVDAWLQGCKGISLFRDGSRTFALVIETSYQRPGVARSTS